MAEPIQFYCDQNIQPGVAKGLRLHGVDVLTAQEAGRCGFSDLDQLQFATSEDRIIITYDRDYLILDASGIPHAGIAWCNATKYSIGQMINSLLTVHGILTRAEMRNHVEYL